MDDHAANSSVAHKEVGTAADDEERQIFASTKTDQFRKSFFVAGFDPKLRRAANAPRRVFRKRLVKFNVTVVAHDLFEFLPDHKIGGKERQLLVNVAGAETQ